MPDHDYSPNRWAEANAVAPEIIASQLGLEPVPRKRKLFACPECGSLKAFGWWAPKNGEAPYRWKCFKGCISATNIDLVALVEGIEPAEAVTAILGDDGGVQGQCNTPKRRRAPKAYGLKSARELSRLEEEHAGVDFWSVAAGNEPEEYRQPMQPKNYQTHFDLVAQAVPAFVTTARDVTRDEGHAILADSAYRLLTTPGTVVCAGGTGTGKTTAFNAAGVARWMREALALQCTEDATAEHGTWQTARKELRNAKRGDASDEEISERTGTVDKAMEARARTNEYKRLHEHGTRPVWVSPSKEVRDTEYVNLRSAIIETTQDDDFWLSPRFAFAWKGKNAVDDVVDSVIHNIRSADDKGCKVPKLRRAVADATGRPGDACKACPHREGCPVFDATGWREGVSLKLATHAMHATAPIAADVMVVDESPRKEIAEQRKGLSLGQVEDFAGFASKSDIDGKVSLAGLLVPLRDTAETPKDAREHVRHIREGALRALVSDVVIDAATVVAYERENEAKAVSLVEQAHGLVGDQLDTVMAQLAALPPVGAVSALLSASTSKWLGASVAQGFVTFSAPARGPWDTNENGVRSMVILDATATSNAHSGRDVRALFGAQTTIDEATNIRLALNEWQTVTAIDGATSSKGFLSSHAREGNVGQFVAAMVEASAKAKDAGTRVYVVTHKDDSLHAMALAEGAELHVHEQGEDAPPGSLVFDWYNSASSRGSNVFGDYGVGLFAAYHCNKTAGVWNLAGAMAFLDDDEDAGRNFLVEAEFYQSQAVMKQSVERMRFALGTEANPKHIYDFTGGQLALVSDRYEATESVDVQDLDWYVTGTLGDDAWRASMLAEIVAEGGSVTIGGKGAQNVVGSDTAHLHRFGIIISARSVHDHGMDFAAAFLADFSALRDERNWTWRGLVEDAGLSIAVRRSSGTTSAVIFEGEGMPEDDVQAALFRSGVTWYDTGDGSVVANTESPTMLAVASVAASNPPDMPRMKFYAAVGVELGISARAAEDRIRRLGGMNLAMATLSPPDMTEDLEPSSPAALTRKMLLAAFIVQDSNVRDIRERYAAGETSQALADEYGSNQQRVYKIVTGKVHKTIGGTAARYPSITRRLAEAQSGGLAGVDRRNRQRLSAGQTPTEIQADDWRRRLRTGETIADIAAADGVELSVVDAYTISSRARPVRRKKPAQITPEDHS